MKALLIGVWLVIASTCMGAGIKVPDKVGPGELVVLEVDDIGSKSASWMAIDPIDLTYRAFDNGQYFAFSSGCQPGRRIIVLVTIVDWDAKTLNQHRAIVVVEGDDSPDPPPPPPTPGKRLVVVVRESADDSPELKLATQAVQKYQAGKGKDLYRLMDDDAVGPNGPLPWLQEILAKAETAKIPLPFMAVIASSEGGEDSVSIVAFPSDGEKAVQEIKKRGG